MLLEETGIVKHYSKVMHHLYLLEDLTHYEDKRVAKAIDALQYFTVEEACKAHMLSTTLPPCTVEERTAFFYSEGWYGNDSEIRVWLEHHETH